MASTTGDDVPGNYSQKIHRLLRLIVLMQQDAAGNAAQLAHLFSVSERTIHRDLETLTDLNIPWFFDDEVGGYRIRRDFFLPPVQLTPAEALAMLALAQCVGGAEQIALTGPAAQATEKIKGQLPAHVLNELGDLGDHIDIHLPATGPPAEAIRDVFADVQHAIRTRRALRCKYESLNSDTDDTVAFFFRPYALSFDQRAWYTIGNHDGRGEVRRLKLNRFTAVEHTDQPYAIPDDFSLDAHRGNAWRMIRGDQSYHIVIDFDRIMADTVSDTNWHRTQQIEEHPDGSITFTCDVDGLDEIVWWILGYGPHAIVREPAELADRVAALTRAAAEHYGSRRDAPLP